MVRIWQKVAAAALAAALGMLPLYVIAQTAPQPEAAPAKAAKAPKAKSAKAAPAGDAAAQKVDPAANQALVEAGIASYQAGKFDAAAQQLTTALSGGRLPSAQMARALYYRGATYRRQSKPALAISDLTSALWLKGGLAEAERGDAMAQRAAAYREAGLPDQADGVAAGAKAATAAPPAAASPKTATVLQTAAIPPAPMPASPAAKPPVLAVAPPPQTAGAAPGSAGVGGFFSNLFGTSSPPAAAPAGAPPQVQALTSGWAQTTEVHPKAAKPAAAAKASARLASAAPAAVVAAPAASAPAAAPAPPVGRFQLQVAAVRSRDEAQAVAQRVKQQYPTEMELRQAVIDEAVIGNMGTLYRVRIGPFADANEPRALCGKLRSSGLDCMLVGQ